MNINYFCDLCFYYKENTNLISLVYPSIFKYKYCKKIPTSLYLKKRIGYLYLLEDYEYISLDFKDLKNLRYLDCPNNKINILNLVECPKLEFLNCSDSEVYILNLSSQSYIKYLDYSHNEDITKVDIKNTQELKYLSCSDGCLILSNLFRKRLCLKYLSISNIPECYHVNKILNCINPYSLIYLDCSHNFCEKLELKNLKNLRYLFCEFNNLTELNIEQTPFLKYLNCSYNRLKNLKTTPFLETLDCRVNKIDDFCFTKNLTCIKSDIVCKIDIDFRIRF